MNSTPAGARATTLPLREPVALTARKLGSLGLITRPGLAGSGLRSNRPMEADLQAQWTVGRGIPSLMLRSV
jgi:hypothetical protein